MLISTFNKVQAWQVGRYALLKPLKKLNVSGNNKRILFYDKIKACLIGYCYHWFIVIIWLLLSFNYYNHSVIVFIRLLLSFSYCYHSVLVIIQFLLSDVAWPNVITLSGTYCSMNLYEKEFLGNQTKYLLFLLIFKNFKSQFFNTV